MADTEKLSLWLVPGGEVRAGIEGVVRRLARLYGAPVFGPHVTLLGGITAGEGEALEAARALASGLAPFEVRFTGAEYMDEYYRCLYLRAEETAELMEAYEAACGAFGVEHPRPFMPHLSLMYGDYPPSVKEEAIRGLVPGLPEGFMAESVSVYRTAGRPEAWALAGEFPFRPRP
jgi:2'-5' RNA ligase